MHTRPRRRTPPSVGRMDRPIRAERIAEGVSIATSAILARVRDHPFAAIEDGATIDPGTGRQGIADLADESWRVRLLAVRDLVRLEGRATEELPSYLDDGNAHVRHIAVMVLGLLRAGAAAGALEARLAEDPDAVVRAQAAIALGQLGLERSLAPLRTDLYRDPSPDVRHRIELAIDQIDRRRQPGPELARQYAALDESTFRTARVGRPAPDFELADTDGRSWRLSDFREVGPVLLIWVFADWCPVCHHEFHDLIELRAEFARRGVQVATVECHDRYRCRVMTGQERQPRYRFASTPPQAQYRTGRWWRHLVDPAGGIGAMYGVDPLEFVVHAEWVNRPSTFIVDAEGILRFAYAGTFWGDRPSIQETLDMVVSDRFEYEHPSRLLAT